MAVLMCPFAVLFLFACNKPTTNGPRHHICSSRVSTHARNRDLEDQIDSLSDAEALLAARAYLQKRKRWGPWEKADERKAMRQRYVTDVKEEDRSRDGAGFFWEDPSQLKYLHKSADLAVASFGSDKSQNVSHFSELHITEEEQDESEDQNTEEEIWESVKLQGSMGRRDLIPLIENDRLLGDVEEFSPFYDAGPSEEHTRRSDAAKRTWSDPEWKAQWYQKRWGNRRPQSNRSKKHKRLEAQLRQLGPEVLENEALASMTEEEITEALLEYIRLKKKNKGGPRSEGESRPTKETQDPTSALDRFVSDDMTTQQALQKERSERARKAYETRLANQQPSLSKHPKRKPLLGSKARQRVVATDDSPLTALRRAEDCLSRGVLPATSDMESILRPARLSRRKDILLRILLECFGLRGKCIETEEDGVFKFATQASIDELGDLILRKLKEAGTKSTY